MKKLLAPLLIVLLSACTNEAYDSGDGRFSYLQADFTEAHTISGKTIDRAVTDDGTTLLFDPFATAEWAEKADTTYRALIYYNKVEGATAFEPVAVVRVPVLSPVAIGEIEGEAKTDPVGLESVWVSTDRKYINLSLLLKTGKADDSEAVQSIGMAKEELADGSIRLQLLHDQGDVPQYYTSRIYLSIAVTSELKNRSVYIRVNTYKGMVEKNITVEPNS